MAFRWLARRLLNSFRSPMMWSMARRWSSRFRRRRSSVSTCARSRRSAVTAAPGSATAACRSSVAVSGIAITLSAASAFRLHPHALQLLFEGDHLQLPADHYFLEFLEIQDLLLELALGLLQVANDLLVFAHVAQDADGTDHLAVRVAQRRSIEGRGDHLPAGAAGVQAGIAGDTALHDLPQGRQELPSLIGRDDARERLLDQLVRPEAQEGEDGVVGLQDLALEIRDEHGVRRILDQALGVGPSLAVLPHVAQDADVGEGLAVGLARGGGPPARRAHPAA